MNIALIALFAICYIYTICAIVELFQCRWSILDGVFATFEVSGLIIAGTCGILACFLGVLVIMPLVPKAYSGPAILVLFPPYAVAMTSFVLLCNEAILWRIERSHKTS